LTDETEKISAGLDAKLRFHFAGAPGKGSGRGPKKLEIIIKIVEKYLNGVHNRIQLATLGGVQ
jgi:hypothetical protein